MTKSSKTPHMIIPFLFLLIPDAIWAEAYDLQALPTEHKMITDPKTGAELTFLTTDPAQDTNFYFHERSWLVDGSLILFTSDRADGGLMGYIVETGELVRITTPTGGLGGATAAVNRPSVYAQRGEDVVELTLSIDISSDVKQTPSKVMASERIICAVPGRTTALNENADGTKLAFGVSGPAIVVIDIQTGEVRELCRLADPPGYGGHVQWSHTDPNLLSFAGRENRLWVVDIRDGKPRNIYPQVADELVTHEHWWVDDQMVFCGGLHPKPTEDAHVKVINIYTGVVRILGAGAWWPGATDEEIAKLNFWHCSGSDDGRWVAADNWYGDITLFEGKTTRPHILTEGHRTYGSGVHPHVGWDRKGKQVIFTSHILGDPNVCVATIPQEWQDANP
ncbi:MAG: hypothetical protein ABIH23_25195 [bacterium]